MEDVVGVEGIISNPDLETTGEVPVVLDKELALRSELAEQAMEAVSWIYDMPVSVDQLMILAQDTEPSDSRLKAKRILRAIESIGIPDSPVIRAIGATSLYHYVEAVVTYGAADWRYLGLIEEHGLDAAEATALYEIRRLVADHTNDHKPGFGELIEALESVGFSVKDAVLDTVAAASLLEQSGYFTGYSDRAVFDSPVFIPHPRGRGTPGKHIDSVRSTETIEWMRDRFEDTLAGKDNYEIE